MREKRGSPNHLGIMRNLELWVYLTFSLRWYTLFMMHTDQQHSAIKTLGVFNLKDRTVLYNSETATPTSEYLWTSISPHLRSFHRGELLVWCELLDVRRSSLPAHCHSPSVIRIKKTYGTRTRLESLGVCVAYPDSQINQMPRDGQGSSLCENTLLMSLFLSLPPLHPHSVSPRSHASSLLSFFSPPLDCSAQSSQTQRSVLELSSRRTCQLKGRRKDRQGSCLWP